MTGSIENPVRQWSESDLLSAALVFLILVPPAGLAIFAVWCGLQAIRGARKGLRIVREELRSIVRGYRRLWHNFWFDLKLWWWAWTEKPERDEVELKEKEPNKREKIRSVKAEYTENLAAIDELPMDEGEKASLRRSMRRRMLLALKSAMIGGSGE